MTEFTCLRRLAVVPTRPVTLTVHRVTTRAADGRTWCHLAVFWYGKPKPPRGDRDRQAFTVPVLIGGRYDCAAIPAAFDAPSRALAADMETSFRNAVHDSSHLAACGHLAAVGGHDDIMAAIDSVGIDWARAMIESVGGAPSDNFEAAMDAITPPPTSEATP